MYHLVEINHKIKDYLEVSMYELKWLPVTEFKFVSNIMLKITFTIAQCNQN